MPRFRVVNPAARRSRDFVFIEPNDARSFGYRLHFGVAAAAILEREAELQNRFLALRNCLASQTGLILPRPALLQDPEVPPDCYQVYFDGIKVGLQPLYPSRLLLVASESELSEVRGLGVRLPVYELQARWFEPAQRAFAEMHGALPLGAGEWLVLHQLMLARRHGYLLFQPQQADKRLQQLRRERPLLATAVCTRFCPATLHQLLRSLLVEEVPIRDLRGVFEACLEGGNQSIPLLVDRVRRKLGRARKIPEDIAVKRVSVGEGGEGLDGIQDLKKEPALLQLTSDRVALYSDESRDPFQRSDLRAQISQLRPRAAAPLRWPIANDEVRPKPAAALFWRLPPPPPGRTEALMSRLKKATRREISFEGFPVSQLAPYALCVRFGRNFLKLFLPGQEVPDGVVQLRQRLHREKRVIMPPVAFGDNLNFEPSEFTVAVHGTVVLRATQTAGSFDELLRAIESVALKFAAEQRGLDD